ncbi:hypothetical protein KC361_g3110 [Hortaea werneckii]|nr:hypothetical protein KC361_g3110 [Hortaea werneckii]KAI7512736.1 hypothetical protein KC347_g2238 [Hortaea werneckii]
MRSFEFIDSRAPDNQQRRNQFLARSHAARAGSRKGRTQSGKQDKGNSSYGKHIPNERDAAQHQGHLHVVRAKRHAQPNLIIHSGPIPRAVSPTFGALTMTLPSWQPHSAEAESLHYYLSFFAPQVMLPQDANDRFLACSQHPIIYHSLQYAALLHREILCSRNDDRTENRQMLVHKMKTIGLLRDLISTLEDRMIDIAVHAVLHLLWEQASVNEASGDEEQVLLFVPHLPSACWINVYGRAKSVCPHLRALKVLVHRAGGLDKIAPDLVRELRVFDLIMASAACVRPAFPYSARVDEAGVLDLLATHFGMETFPSFGSGLQLRHELPTAALEVYDRMCMLDALLPFCQSLRRGDAEYDVLLMARSGFYHRLLSLPSWHELPEFEKRTISWTTYELCRITVLLYSSAVIYPMPAQCGWHLKRLGSMRAVLATYTAQKVQTLDDSLRIWCLCVGGIAAFGTSQRSFFQSSLEETLRRLSLTSYSAVGKLNRRFLWSDDACARGVAALWDAMGMEI